METVNVVLSRAAFDHLEEVIARTDSTGDPVGIVLDEEHARHIHGALTLALGGISPPPVGAQG